MSNVLQLSAPLLWQAKINLLSDRSENLDCQIEACNDIAAVGSWLNRYSKATTFITYKKEAERFLLWCAYERGLYLDQLKVHDFEAYFQFLQNPPAAWVANKRPGRKGRLEGDWRPFLGPLSGASLAVAIRAIHSLMNFLVDAQYLKRNPILLIRRLKDFKQIAQERRLKVKERMLERDEWQAVQQALNELPEGNEAEVDDKLRTQFLFALLYLLGLRIHEVANHRWGDFRQFNGQWCFLVLGKGEKLRDIQVNDQLLSIIKIYRLHLNKIPLPFPSETEPLMVSKRTKKPLKVRQLFQLVKNVGRLAALKFIDQPEKAKKLENLSPHWLRHLLASHLDEAGSSGSMIQSILRHESFATTQAYLHMEEKRRREEIEKIRMEIIPKLIMQLPEKLQTKLILNLKGGPLSEVLGLKRFIFILDTHILKEWAWERQESLNEIIQRYEKFRVLREPLAITYQLEGIIDVKQMDCIKKSIERESNIRLFQCHLQILTENVN